MVKWHIGTYARIRPPRRGHDCAKFMLSKRALWLLTTCVC